MCIMKIYNQIFIIINYGHRHATLRMEVLMMGQFIKIALSAENDVFAQL